MKWNVVLKIIDENNRIVEYGICNELGERKRIYKQDIRKYNIVSHTITTDGKLLGPTVKVLKRSDLEKNSKGKTTSGLLSPILIGSKNINNLYHGSRTGIQMPIKPNFSNKRGDFGIGFYLGDNKNQANNIVRKYSTAKLYRIGLNLSDLTLFDLSRDWELWSMYILYSRGIVPINDFPHKLTKQIKLINSSDVVFGAIADDDVISAIRAFRINSLTLDGFKACLQYNNYGNQYTLKTNKACSQVSIQGILNVSRKYLGGSAKWKSSEQLIDEKIKEYRSSGFYYKDILRKWR